MSSVTTAVEDIDALNAEDIDLSLLTDDERAEYDDLLRSLVQHDEYDWFKRAHSEKQLMPITMQGWQTMFARCGRGFGKTEIGAQWVRWLCENNSNIVIAIVAPTKKDLRETIATAVLNAFPPHSRPRFVPSNQRIDRLPRNNLIVLYSEENGDLVRGANLSYAWLDEIGSWSSKAMDTYANIRFALRKGANPQCLITSTPRPTEFCKQVCEEKGIVIVTGSTFENPHLSPQAIQFYRDNYEGTRLGRQELYGELLLDTVGALWTAKLVDDALIKEIKCDLKHIVIAVDPATTSNAKSDLTGIVVVAQGEDDLFYVLEDCSGTYTPGAWAAKVCELYEHYDASVVVGEANNGGDLIESNIRSINPYIHYQKVHATSGKHRRAEPIVGIYEQGKVKHLPALSELEKELTTWCPHDKTAKSPDRLDALVWGLTYLLRQRRKRGRVY